MLRIIVREIDVSDAAHVGGPVATSYRTFDIEAPVLEAWLRDQSHGYIRRETVGVEVLPLPHAETKEQTNEERTRVDANGHSQSHQ